MSNAAKMTLEEKLVQHIKDVGLGALITDEDAITELTRKAVESALLQPRRTKDGYQYNEKDSPVVESARAVADMALAKIFDERVAILFASPEALDCLNKAIAIAFPVALEKAASNALHTAFASTRFEIEGSILQQLRSRGIPV